MHQPNSGDPNAGFYGAPGQTPYGRTPYGQNNNGGLPPMLPGLGTPNVPLPGERSLPNISELVNALKRRWLLVLIVGTLLGTMLAAGVWMALPSGKHQARAIIRMKYRPNETMLKDFNQAQLQDEFDIFKENQKTLMMTRLFLKQVVGNPEVARLPIIEAADDKPRVFEDMIDIIWGDNIETMMIKMNGDDANTLKVMLTAFVNEYIAMAQSEEKTIRSAKIKELEQAIETIEGEIKKHQERLDAVEKINGDSSPESKGLFKPLYMNQLGNIKSDITKYTQEVDTLSKQIELIESRLKSEDMKVDPDLLALAINDDPRVKSKRQAYEDTLLRYQNTREKVQPTSPALVEMEKKVQEAAAVLEAERNSLKGLLEGSVLAQQIREMRTDLIKKNNDLSIAKSSLIKAKDMEKSLEAQINQLVVAGPDTQMLRKDIATLSEQKTNLFVMKTQTNTVDPEPRVTVRENAEVIENYNLKTKMFAAIGLGLAGLLGAALVISYIEWRNRRVDGVDQVVNELQMRVIGTIPAFPSRASLRSGEANQNQNWRFILNESVNSTRTMLLHAARTQQMQVIMVTSAMQGEGKTSLSSQLATSMATAGLRTLILDFDLRNPSMQKLFDIPVAPGCSEVLLQEVDLSDVIQATTVPNLWIMPAGQCNHRVIAALAQGHPIEAMLGRLRGQFDLIVVDSCPILPVADTLLVAQHVDGVVFSILQDVSQLPKVMNASERLVQLNIPLLGAVVNGIKPDIQAYGYNYVKQLPA